MAASRSQDNASNLDQASKNSVIVEFYGVARLRAGREKLTVTAGTVREALQGAAHVCSGLIGLFTSSGELQSQYLVSMNGQRFVKDLDRPLADGDQLLLLGADSGG